MGVRASSAPCAERRSITHLVLYHAHATGHRDLPFALSWIMDFVAPETAAAPPHSAEPVTDSTDIAAVVFFW